MTIQNRICPSCGFNRNWPDAEKCHKCGKSFKPSADYSLIIVSLVTVLVLGAIGYGGYEIYRKKLISKTLVSAETKTVALLAMFKAKLPVSQFSVKPAELSEPAVPAVVQEEKSVPAPEIKPEKKPDPAAAEPKEVPAVKIPFKPHDPDMTNMAFIASGEFTMGSSGEGGDPDELPVRKVNLKSYYIDKYETTAAEYAKCAAEGQCKPISGPRCNGANKADMPANCATWKQADSFCKWAGKRLPTEAEWEKAARAGGDSKFSFGADNSQLKEYAWYDANAEDKLHPVGKKLPNAYGIYDIYGNAWEWVSDWYSSNYAGMPSEDPQGPKSGRHKVLRGGSSVDVADTCRSANRFRAEPGSANPMYGFRCAVSAK